MIHIEITNYESIKHTSFDIDGFTTFVGRNYIGKSSTLRAINAALTNAQGMDFIRWGESFCEVRIKTDKVDILWHKEKGNNFYDINGKTYKKIGTQPPPPAVAEAGFGLVPVDKDKISLFYSEQFQPLFLVDKRDSKSADLLISLYGLDRLYKAMSLCRKDRASNKSLLKVRQGDLEVAEHALDRFKDFEKTKAFVDSLASMKENIQGQEEEIELLKGKLKLIVSSIISVKKLKPVLDVKVPDIARIADSQQALNELKDKSKTFEELTSAAARYKKAAHVEIPNTDTVRKTAEETANLETLFERYQDLSKTTKRLRKTKKVKVPTPPDPAKVEELKDIYTRLVDQLRTVKKLRNDVETAKQQLEDIEAKRQKYDRCPLCGSDLKKSS